MRFFFPYCPDSYGSTGDGTDHPIGLTKSELYTLYARWKSIRLDVSAVYTGPYTGTISVKSSGLKSAFKCGFASGYPGTDCRAWQTQTITQSFSCSATSAPLTGAPGDCDGQIMKEIYSGSVSRESSYPAPVVNGFSCGSISSSNSGAIHRHRETCSYEDGTWQVSDSDQTDISGAYLSTVSWTSATGASGSEATACGQETWPGIGNYTTKITLSSEATDAMLITFLTGSVSSAISAATPYTTSGSVTVGQANSSISGGFICSASASGSTFTFIDDPSGYPCATATLQWEISGYGTGTATSFTFIPSSSAFDGSSHSYVLTATVHHQWIYAETFLVHRDGSKCVTAGDTQAGMVCGVGTDFSFMTSCIPEKKCGELVMFGAKDDTSSVIISSGKFWPRITLDFGPFSTLSSAGPIVGNLRINSELTGAVGHKYIPVYGPSGAVFAGILSGISHW